MFKIDSYFDMIDNNPARIKYIERFPSALLLMDKEEAERVENLPISNAEHSLLQVLKSRALAVPNSGFLIFGFINNGFTINKNLIETALCSSPSICAQCPMEWFTKRAIRKILKQDVRNIIYLPKEIFVKDEQGNKALTKFLQQEIRRQLANNPKLYTSLPRDIVEGKYTAYTSLNAFVENGKEDRAMSVISKNIWQTNGGKIMFNIARHNVDIAIKMLNENQKQSLALELMKTNYKTYEKFPESLKQDKKVKLHLFYHCKKNKDEAFINKYFTYDEQIANIKQMNINAKRSRTIAEKKNMNEYKMIKLTQEIEDLK